MIFSVEECRIIERKLKMWMCHWPGVLAWASLWEVEVRNVGVCFVLVDHVWKRQSMKNLLYRVLKYVLPKVQRVSGGGELGP